MTKTLVVLWALLVAHGAALSADRARVMGPPSLWLSGPIEALAVTPDGAHVAAICGGPMPELVIARVDDQRIVSRRPVRIGARVAAVNVAGRVGFALADADTVTWLTPAGAELRKSVALPGVVEIASDRSGKRLFAAGAALFELSSGAAVTVATGAAPRQLTVSADGRLGFVIGRTLTLVTLTPSGSKVASLMSPPALAYAFKPDGSWVRWDGRALTSEKDGQIFEPKARGAAVEPEAIGTVAPRIALDEVHTLVALDQDTLVLSDRRDRLGVLVRDVGPWHLTDADPRIDVAPYTTLFAKGGKVIVAGSYLGAVRVLTPAQRVEWRHDWMVTRLTWSADGRELTSFQGGLGRHRTIVWDSARGQALRGEGLKTNEPRSFQLGDELADGETDVTRDDAHRVVVGRNHIRVRVGDVRQRANLVDDGGAALMATTGRMQHPVVAVTSEVAVVALEGGRLVAWRLAPFERAWTHALPQGVEVEGLSATRDGRRLATNSQGDLVVMDVTAKGLVVSERIATDGRLGVVALSPDGKRVARVRNTALVEVVTLKR